jgi:predicted RNA-binding protein YlxR (DUF448 family)
MKTTANTPRQPAQNAPQKAKQPQKARHIPERTCVACKQVRPKRELLRVVRTPDGHVLLDPTGKKSGRGAYLCAKRSCWEIGLNKGRLEREFELTLPAEDRAALEAFVETLPVEAAAPKVAKVAKPRAPREAQPR